jgi:hypothetical protein
VLRFGTATTNRRKLTTGRDRWRLWMLFVAACMVLWCMRMLQRPDVSRRIDAVLTSTLENQAVRVPNENVDLAQVETEDVRSSSAIAFEGNELVPVAGEHFQSRFDLSAVRDNTYFRAEEYPAWFAIWDYLQDVKPEKLDEQSTGEVTYAQLIDQPEIFRGNPVTIRGMAMRVEVLDAPDNDVGIESYFRLIIRPTGGGVWPIVLYCLELPPKFPRGEDLRADVEVVGVFFKNWSYSWQGGLGLAPVVLANSFDWQPASVVERPRTELTPQGVLVVVAIAGIMATIVGWYAWTQTRRPMASIGEHKIVISRPSEVER